MCKLRELTIETDVRTADSVADLRCAEVSCAEPADQSPEFRFAQNTPT